VNFFVYFNLDSINQSAFLFNRKTLLNPSLLISRTEKSLRALKDFGKISDFSKGVFFVDVFACPKEPQKSVGMN